MNAFDIGAVTASLSVMAVYNIANFVPIPFLGPRRTFSRSAKSARAWIQRHFESPDMAHSIMAVQTVRNTIYVGIFMGGASAANGIRAVADIGTAATPATVRAVVIAVLMFGSFLSWAMVIRLGVHLGYFIGIFGFRDVHSRLDEAELAIVEEEEKDQLRIGLEMMDALVTRFSIGYRCWFACIPFLFYYNGPVALVIATAAMTVFVFYWDNYKRFDLNWNEPED